MILLLSFRDDPMIRLVADRLDARGAEYWLFDSAQFPCEASVSVHYSGSGKVSYRVRTKDRTVNLADVHVAWTHRPGRAKPEENLAPMSARFAASEGSRFMADIWRTMDCRWLPAHKDVVLRAQHKASQLKLARELGFETPATLMTNNPGDFLEFHRKRNGRIISKVFYQNAYEPEGDPDEASAFNCMTQLVSNRDLGYAAGIRHSPVIFQAYVPKELELRVTVVGRRVLAAAIHSQGTHRTRHDWRHADLNHTRYTAYQLPESVEKLCLKLLESLGLCFGTIDLILTPDDRYVFLEINPSGQWRWVEQLTGLPIADSMAQLLAEYDRPSTHAGS